MKISDIMWFLLVVLAAFVIIENHFSIPDVYWSTSKNECVKVVSDGGIESGCSDLPEKYHRIWVK